MLALPDPRIMAGQDDEAAHDGVEGEGDGGADQIRCHHAAPRASVDLTLIAT